jgi:hypothetical protein
MTGAESARWWRVPRAAVWIRTRDRVAVDKLDERQSGSLALASMAIAGTLTASACLREALRLGRFAARGRLVRPELVVASGERAYRILNDHAEPIPPRWDCVPFPIFHENARGLPRRQGRHGSTRSHACKHSMSSAHACGLNSGRLTLLGWRRAKAAGRPMSPSTFPAVPSDATQPTLL